MRTLFFLIVGCFATNFIVIAQKPVTIDASTIAFKHGKIPGFVLSIPEVPNKTITEAWIKIQEKGTKSKVQNDYGELSIFGALIKDVALAPINVYSIIKNQDSINLLFVAFELKPKEYINKEDRDFEFNKAKEFLFNFGKGQYLEMTGDHLQTEEKKLKKMETDLKSLEADKVRMEKMIMTNKIDISATNDEITAAKTNLKSLKDEEQSQNTQFTGMTDGPAKEEKLKYIGDLEKRIAKTNRSIESDEKKITDWKTEIDVAENTNMPNNLNQQKTLRSDIDKQREVVRMATEKYNRIKSFR